MREFERERDLQLYLVNVMERFRKRYPGPQPHTDRVAPCSDARSVVRIKDDTAAGRVALPESVAERCAIISWWRGRYAAAKLRACLLVSYR